MSRLEVAIFESAGDTLYSELRTETYLYVDDGEGYWIQNPVRTETWNVKTHTKAKILGLDESATGWYFDYSLLKKYHACEAMKILFGQS